MGYAFIHIPICTTRMVFAYEVRPTSIIQVHTCNTTKYKRHRHCKLLHRTTRLPNMVSRICAPADSMQYWVLLIPIKD